MKVQAVGASGQPEGRGAGGGAAVPYRAGMIAWQIFEPKDVSSLQRVEIPQPEAGPGEIRVKMRAVSLNYRDLTTVRMAADMMSARRSMQPSMK